MSLFVGAVGREPVRGDRFDAERPEQQRQHERRGRVSVVDDETEAARTNRVGVDTFEEVRRVGLPDARRIVDSAHAAKRDASQLPAREVLLHFLLQCRGHLDPGRLEEPDLHHFGIADARADVRAGVVALAFQQMPRNGSRQHA